MEIFDTNEPIREYEKSRNEQIKENERYLKTRFSPKPDLDLVPEIHTDKNHPIQLSQSPIYKSEEEIPETSRGFARSLNNCGVHTFIRILTIDNEDLSMAFSRIIVWQYASGWFIPYCKAKWNKESGIKILPFREAGGGLDTVCSCTKTKITPQEKQSNKYNIAERVYSADAVMFCLTAVKYKDLREHMFTMFYY